MKKTTSRELELINYNNNFVRNKIFKIFKAIELKSSSRFNSIKFKIKQHLSTDKAKQAQLENEYEKYITLLNSDHPCNKFTILPDGSTQSIKYINGFPVVKTYSKDQKSLDAYALENSEKLNYQGIVKNKLGKYQYFSIELHSADQLWSDDFNPKICKFSTQTKYSMLLATKTFGKKSFHTDIRKYSSPEINIENSSNYSTLKTIYAYSKASLKNPITQNSLIAKDKFITTLNKDTRELLFTLSKTFKENTNDSSLVFETQPQH